MPKFIARYLYTSSLDKELCLKWIQKLRPGSRNLTMLETTNDTSADSSKMFRKSVQLLNRIRGCIKKPHMCRFENTLFTAIILISNPHTHGIPLLPLKSCYLSYEYSKLPVCGGRQNFGSSRGFLSRSRLQNFADRDSEMEE